MTTLPFSSHIFIFFLHPHRCYCPYGTSQLSTCLLAASTTTWQCGEEQPAQTAHIREASGHGQHAKMIPERCAVRGKCPPAQTQRRPSWLNTPLLHKTPPPPQNTTSMHARNYSSPTHHRGIWSSVHSGTFTPAGARGAPDGEPQGFNETAVQWKSRYRRQHTGHGSFQRVPVLMCHTVNSGSLSLPELSAAWSKHRGQADRGRVAFKIKA